MSSLQNKIDFVALVSVTRANSNGDPLNGNRPRTDLNGFGEISDVCIKRKIRNRMQDLGKPIFVQSEDRCSDGCGSLSERASAAMKGIKDREEYARRACETWLDVRTFGQVFAFKDAKGFSCGVRGPVSIHQASSLSPVEIESLQITKSVNGEKKEKGENRASDTMGMKHFVRFGLYEIKGSINVQLAEKTGFSDEVFAFKDAKGFSCGVRGPVSIHQASSLSPVEIESLQITKSVNGEKKEKGENRASDTMGMKHFVRFGLYEIKGSINVQLAEKTGFSDEDADTVKECLRTLFVNDASSARPDGSMEVVKLFWWRHSCKDGQYSSARVHRSVKVALRDAGTIPTAADDYVISLEALPGLEPEVIDGV